MKRLYKSLLAGAVTLAMMQAVPAFAQQVQGFVHRQSTEYTWPTEPEVLRNLDKWQDQKFGVLFHWGLYSVPGIVESWSICSEDVDWIRRRQDMDYETYKKWYWGLKDSLNPTQFDPERWAEIMADAGMRYMIFTTKHHDGFCMYDSKETDFSIAHGPFRNDPRRDVARHVWDAFRKKNFMIGAYFSKPDWHSPYYWWPRFATPNRNVNYKIERHPEQWEKFQQYTARQIDELMTGYGHFDILWLDGGWVAAPKQDIRLDEIVAKARRTQPNLLVVDRTIHGPNENYQTPERSIPDKQLPYPWESCITLSNDWGWVPNAPYKSSQKVINMLIEVVAKGGCLLLGVGPTAQGTIEDAVAERLHGVGEWLRCNGEAIYNTRPTANYHDGSVWFTAHKDGKTLYALYALPEGETLPAAISWKGNLPKGKLVLLQNGKKIKCKIEGDRVTVPVPPSIRQEPIVFRFEKE